MRDWTLKSVLVLGSLAAFYFVGNFIQHGVEPERPAIFEEAECQRAALDAKDGNADPQLLEECRRKGLLPEVTVRPEDD